MPADTYDLISLTEAYRAINDDVSAAAGTGPHDTELFQWVTAVSHRIDELCGPVVRRTVSNERHPGGSPYIIPKYRPVLAVSTIVEYSGTSPQALTAEAFLTNAATVTANDYYLDPESSFVYRRVSGSAGCFAARAVVLTYPAGRGSVSGTNDVTTVDTKFKLAVGSIMRRLWAREAGAWARGGDPFAPMEGHQSAGFFKAIDPLVHEFLPEELVSASTVPIIG